MTAHVPMARVPFAPLDSPRLQLLASAKNRQNGLLKSAALNHAKTSMKGAVTSSNNHKRAYEASTFDDFDGENVDPAMFDSPASKKPKGNAKPFTFTVHTSAVKSMPPPVMKTPLRANASALRAPSTAPAGRSPKRKIAGMKSTRRISAPFGRVDPPSFSSASTLPFSLDAALNGTLPQTKSEGATIAESMPKNWFFEIHEDTPEEEAANLMEHSTLTLDLSSDDETAKKADDYRGKENTPPEGYDAPTASRSSSSAGVAVQKDIVRKKLVADDLDDGSRSPLSNLETEGFIPEGLTKDDFVVVDEVVEKVVEEAVDVVEVETNEVESKADVTGEIVVWEDESA